MSWKEIFWPSLAPRRSPERLAELRRDAKQMIWDLVDLELPLVVAINGPAVGLGATIALLGEAVESA